MNRFLTQAVLSGALFLAVGALHLSGEVKLPAIFGDHMVLQEGAKLPVWGTASPGEAVAVTVGGDTAQTKAGADGKWRVDLAPLPTDAAPVTMTVKGTNTVTFSDVLVGEVWLCSGQSNMGFSLGGGLTFGGADNGKTTGPQIAAQANDPQLRLFHVGRSNHLDPQTDLQGAWQLCAPDSAAPFSAVGYLFGRELRADLKRPVGLIESAVGGTPAQAWTSLSGLETDPVLKPYVDQSNRLHTNLAQNTADYPAKQAAYGAKALKWRQSPAGQAFMQKMKAWPAAVAAAKAAGQPLPPRPLPRGAPKAPEAPDGGAAAPAVLYNGMIAPLIPYAIKGAIWYQGESNSAQAGFYGPIFGTMIRDWRQKWGEGDFPFIYVQLAAFKGPPEPSWPLVREAQLKTLALPDTAMASAVDVGNPGNIHPTDKQDVGHRVALAARHLAYGEDVVASGPIYQSMAVSGNTIKLSFTDAGGGLIIGSAPWVAPGQTPLPTDRLVGFAIAGADRKFVAAAAKIVGNGVVVSSPEVASPVAARYDWANAPQGNLYNREMLPASPFRTDDWPDPAAEGHLP